MSIVPPIKAKGLYSVKEPFKVEPTVQYECIAQRKFTDLVKMNIDVYSRYYSTYGLTEEDYKRDVVDDVLLITLFSESAGILYIPSSYIDSYPEESAVTFRHRILSVSLGAIPDSLPLEEFTAQMRSLASDVIGIEPIVTLHSVELSDAVTKDTANAFEAARQARIVSRTTERAQLIAARSENDALRQRIELLESVLLSQS